MKTHVFVNASDNPDHEGVKDVSPEDLFKNKDNVHLIDVRRPDEFDGELGHIHDSKLLVLDTLPERISEIPKDETVVLICRSGNRSAQASKYLQQQGYEKTYNMLGGMLLWNKQGLAVEITED